MLRDGDGAGLKKRERPAPSQRQLRVAEEIRHVLAACSSAAISAIPSWPRRRSPSTEVRIGPDLKHATAFVSRLGPFGCRCAAAGVEARGAVSARPGGACAAAEVRAGPDVPAGPRAGICDQDRSAAASPGGRARPGGKRIAGIACALTAAAVPPSVPSARGGCARITSSFTSTPQPGPVGNTNMPSSIFGTGVTPVRPSRARPRCRSPSPGSSGSPRTYARSSASRYGR